METKYNRTHRNFVGLTNTKGEGFIIFKCIRRALGRSTCCELSSKEQKRTHLYVLTNCEDVICFLL